MLPSPARTADIQKQRAGNPTPAEYIWLLYEITSAQMQFVRILNATQYYPIKYSLTSSHHYLLLEHLPL